MVEHSWAIAFDVVVVDNGVLDLRQEPLQPGLAIEQSPGVVRVRKLRLRESQENKDTLDVTLTVSAWQAA